MRSWVLKMPAEPEKDQLTMDSHFRTSLSSEVHSLATPVLKSTLRFSFSDSWKLCIFMRGRYPGMQRRSQVQGDAQSRSVQNRKSEKHT